MSTKPNYHLGAHLSIAGGLTNALEKTKAIGGNCLQLFSSSPRQWQRFPISTKQIEQFRECKKELAIDPIYFHAPYLVNFAADDTIGEASQKIITYELDLAAKMEIKGTIIHLGSFKDAHTDSPGFSPVIKKQYDHFISRIQSLLDDTPEQTLFIIENAGNRKIGMTLEQIAQIINDVGDPRVRVCLDTCHLHAAGYDLATPATFDFFFSSFDKLIGLDKLELFQVNDSKDPFGSFRDRHENIGEGQLPSSVFQQLVNDERTKHLPLIIETPGFDKKGPDKENLERLQSYIK